MPDALGVDHAPADTSAPFVLTATLPESVLRNARISAQRKEQAAWNERKAQGRTAFDDIPPPGPDVWETLTPTMIMAALAGLAVGVVTQMIAGVTPGVWGGLCACALTFMARLYWLEWKQDRDAEVLKDNQRVIANRQDYESILKAYRAARSVTRLWPNLPQYRPPVGDTQVVDVLREALWALSGTILEYRALADAEASLRTARVGIPAADPTTGQLASHLRRAESKRSAKEAEVEEQIAHIAELAYLCERLHSEREAIRKAQDVMQATIAILGPVGVADRAAGEADALTQRAAEVLDAYRWLEARCPRAGDPMRPASPQRA